MKYSLLLVLFFVSCNEKFTPKQRAYQWIKFPDKKYSTFHDSHIPFSFDLPQYAQVSRDSSFFNETRENKNWINIKFPEFNGVIYLSYIPIGTQSSYKIKLQDGSYRDSFSTNTFKSLLGQSYGLAYSHVYKANSIQDSFFSINEKINGVFYTITGNTATKYQFFVTDTNRHFLRGVLYFDVTPNEDSLAPVQDFIAEDMKHFIQTLQWRK